MPSHIKHKHYTSYYYWMQTHFNCRICTNTRPQNHVEMSALLQRYCGLHSHGFSEWGGVLPVLHRWRGSGGELTFLSWGEGLGRTFTFSLFSFFMTDSRTSSAKNPGAGGSSPWCRACPEKTWGTCNPEGDLEEESHTGKSTAGYPRRPPASECTTADMLHIYIYFHL